MPARPIMRFVRRLTSIAGAMAIAASINVVQAEDAWNPFKERDEAARRKAVVREPEKPALSPFEGVWPWAKAGPQAPGKDTVEPGPGEPYPYGSPERDRPGPEAVERQPIPSEREREVQRTDLAPVLAGDGTGLPAELWQGIDAKSVHGLVTRLEIPPHSPALHTLWRRLWLASAQVPQQGADSGRFEALRVEALHRSGLLRDLIERLDKDRASAPQDPLYLALAARARVGAGDLKGGCADARDLSRRADVPKAIRGEMLLIGGLCALTENDLGAAGLAADLVRAEGIDAPIPLAALDAATTGQPFKPQLPKRLALIDYRFLAAAKSIAFADALERAEPALLVVLATDPALEPDAARRLKAAELAARLNALGPEALADVYRSQSFQAADLAEPLTAKVDPALRRALLFKAAEGERTPLKRTRLIRALIDDARRAGLYMPVAALVARTTDELAPVPEIGWFAETAIEIGLASSHYDMARKWIDLASRGDRGTNLQHWLVLVDIADVKMPGQRGASLVHAEQIAVRGRLAPDLMHRLVTVLDALDYQIPIPLWEAASRTPQPTTGHLPETGVLTELQDASKKKEFARTLLLVLHALGPDGADRAHIIALGDTVRALHRAGLEADARRLALEAVFAGWPRSASH